MIKHVLIISASPRRGGNSDMLCDKFMEGAREAGHIAEKVFLKNRNINYCMGCGDCLNDKKMCPFKDDATEIVGKMVAADVIVMATPVYFYTMNAQMKTIIDRTFSRYTEIIGKDFYFIVTAADDTVAALDRTIEGFRGFTSCLDDVREKGVIYGTGVWQPGDIQKSPAMHEAYLAGLNI